MTKDERNKNIQDYEAIYSRWLKANKDGSLKSNELDELKRELDYVAPEMERKPIAERRGDVWDDPLDCGEVGSRSNALFVDQGKAAIRQLGHVAQPEAGDPTLVMERRDFVHQRHHHMDDIFGRKAIRVAVEICPEVDGLGRLNRFQRSSVHVRPPLLPVRSGGRSSASSS